MSRRIEVTVDISDALAEVTATEAVEHFGETEILDEIDIAAAIEHYEQDNILDNISLTDIIEHYGMEEISDEIKDMLKGNIENIDIFKEN